MNKDGIIGSIALLISMPLAWVVLDFKEITPKDVLHATFGIWIGVYVLNKILFK